MAWIGLQVRVRLSVAGCSACVLFGGCSRLLHGGAGAGAVHAAVASSEDGETQDRPLESRRGHRE